VEQTLQLTGLLDVYPHYNSVAEAVAELTADTARLAGL
jgi:hypothetical protein